jgi:hypothetical protein
VIALWLVVGALWGIVASLIVFRVFTARAMCESYMDTLLDLLARDPATRDMTLREFTAQRRHEEH